MIKDADLDFWVKNKLNVCLVGERGVGKTSIVLDAWARNGINNFLYFSGATLDPWVDFVGIPKEAVDEKGTKYLDLVRPRAFAYDNVRAIFIDEYNRSHAKIRNAAMELIQFKSINGKKFNNLEMVWIAINPFDEAEKSYDVDRLDPAQQDRFHIYAEVPYKCSPAYFKGKFGEDGISAVAWWNKLSKENQKLISPRRLDYALEIFKNGGNVNFVLDERINRGEFIQAIQHGPIQESFKKAVSAMDGLKVREFFKNPNTTTYLINGFPFTELTDKGRLLVLQYCGDEAAMTLLSSKEEFAKTAALNMREDVVYNYCVKLNPAKMTRELKEAFGRRQAIEKERLLAANIAKANTQTVVNNPWTLPSVPTDRNAGNGVCDPSIQKILSDIKFKNAKDVPNMQERRDADLKLNTLGIQFVLMNTSQTARMSLIHLFCRHFISTQVVSFDQFVFLTSNNFEALINSLNGHAAVSGLVKKDGIGPLYGAAIQKAGLIGRMK